MTFWAAGISAVVGAGVSYASSENAANGAKDAAGMSASAAQNATQLQGAIYDQTRYDQRPWREGGKNALDKLLMGIGSPNQTSVRDLAGFNEDGWNNEWNKLVYGGAKFGNESQVADLTANTEAAYRKKYGNPVDPVDSDPNNGALLKNFSMADYEADPGYAFRLQQGQQALERSAAARGGLYSGRAAKDLTNYAQGAASQEYQNAYNRYQSNQTNQFNRLASVAGVGQTANNALATAGTNYANSVGNIGMTNAANQGNAALTAANATASGYTGLAKSLGGVNWGSLGGSSGGSSPGYTYNGTNGAEDFTNGWNSSNYG